MASHQNHLKRCADCNQWTDGSLDKCSHCGAQLDKKYKEEIKRREEMGDPRLPIIQIDKSDPIWIKVIKRPIQLVQIVVYAIIAFLVYLTTVFAH